MTKKNIEKNVQTLKNKRDRLRRKINTQTLQKINTLIDLYEDRKISQFDTANNLINTISTSDEKERKKGLKKYEKAIEKYENIAPIAQRMRGTVEQANQGRIQATRKRLQKTLAKDGKAFEVKYMLFSTENRTGSKIRPKRHNGKSYYTVLTNPAVRSAYVKAIPEYINEKVKVMMDRFDEASEFRKMITTLSTDNTFKQMAEGSELINYVDAIRVEQVEFLDENTLDFDVFNENLTKSENVSIFHRYIETEVDVEKLTLKEAIQKEHYRENECWINSLMDFYGDTLMRHKRKSIKNMTRENILKTLGMTEEEFVTKGASINQMVSVFQRYQLSARLYDFECRQFYKHEPEDYKHKGQKVFYGLIKNNHIYTLNYNTLSIAKKEKLPSEFEMKISSNYYISDRKEPIKHKMISSLDEILQLREHDEFKEAGYEPQIKWNAGCIKEIRARFTYKLEHRKRKTVSYIIDTQHLDTDRINEDIHIECEEKHNFLSKVMFDFNKAIFTENHKSYYSETDINVLDECRTVVPHGQLMGENMKDVSYSAFPPEVVEIDICKAFTSAFSKIKSIPVFNEFDVWRPFLNTNDINSMSNYTLYMVKACQGNLFFNKKINLVYGKFLKQLVSNGVVVKILYYKQPSRIHKVKYKKLVDELYNAKISDKAEEDKWIKKLIANITFGLLEKGQNKANRSKIFDTLDETLHYQKQYGGQIFSLDHYLLEGNDPMLPPPKVEYYDDDDEEVKEIKPKIYIAGVGTVQEYNVAEKTSKYYILNVSDSRTLTNGYRYIKEMLLQYHNFAMYDAYRKLKIENNIDVHVVKTDALHINKTDMKKVEKLLDFHNGIGGWRFEHKRARCPDGKYMYKHNEVPNIPTYKNEQLIVKDEWDTKAICEQIAEKKQVMIRAKYAGSGKSYICEYFQKMGYNVLFVVPHNRLAQEISCEAVTLNKFFSIPVDKGDSLPLYYHDDYNVIVFDEIYMSNMFVLNKVRQFALNHPEKIIIGTGDTKQLPPIQDLTNTQYHETYADNCIDIIFKHNIFLKVCKRVGGKDTPEGEKGREIMKNLYDDFWVNNLPIEDIIKKYFRFSSDVMDGNENIAYTNIRCRMVANEVRRRMNKTEQYEVGEELICRKYRKALDGTLNVNIRWKIISVEDENLVIQNIKDPKDTRKLYKTIIAKHFIYSYCATCHSVQGTSIKDSITIHEWDKTYLVSKEWLWCSLTRARDLNKVYFFKNPEYDKFMNEELIRNYFQNKINGYKIQDRKAEREIDEENYINIQWCLDRFKGYCGKCGVKFEFETHNGQLSSNFTGQRLENELGHTTDNCESWCKYCNCSAC